MLGSEGWLPPGRHGATVDEFYEHFVDAFGGSSTRKRLFLRWQRHRQALTSVFPITAQWINGSFVTAKVDPNDVDVVTLFDAEAYDALAPGLQDMVKGMLSGKATKSVWGIDSYPLPIYPEGHALAPDTAKAQDVWHRFWQKVRGDESAMKGYLEVLT